LKRFEESMIFQQAFNLTILTMYYNRVNFKIWQFGPSAKKLMLPL